MNFLSLAKRAPPLAIAGSYLLLALPASRSWLEASMAAHMLVQMPLLVALGVAAIRQLAGRQREALLARLGGPLPCMTIALFASTYWMLPRALDAAIVDPASEMMKFASLPLLVGAPLALAWQRLGLIGRGFVWTNLISMLAFLGWLYLAAPLRVCNNYLADEQLRVGWLLVELAGGLFACWLGAFFFGSQAAPSGQPTGGKGIEFTPPPHAAGSVS